MADHVFSAARLRGYRVLEHAGLGEAVDLQILDTAIAGKLWLPFSLIEIALRNAADRAISASHPSGEDWLITAGRDGDTLVASAVASPAAFRSFRAGGSEEDPVADAARNAAKQLGRDRISRDDLIAHLMLGFWVHRCPEALAHDPGLHVWELMAATLAAPLDDSSHLKKVMVQLLRTRNRVAHHEPLLFRPKHVFTRAGNPKIAGDLITSLEGAIPALLKEVELTVETAKTMAPMAMKYLDPVPATVRSEVAPFEATLARERRRLREAMDARLAAREADLAARRTSREQ